MGGAGRGGRLEGSTQLILKVKGGSTSQRMQMSLKVRKGKKTDYPLDLLEGVQPVQHLDFYPMKPTSNFRPPEGNLLLLDNTFV